MPVSYDKKDAVQVWPEAEYPATLEKVEDSTSKKTGKEMQIWTFRVYNEDREQLISEYVVPPGGTFRIKQLAVALGKLPEFESMAFQADDHIGANVMVDLIVEKQEGYDDKNRVKKIKPLNAGNDSPAPARQPSRASGGGRKETSPPFTGDNEFPDDSIPFRHQQPQRWV